MRSLADDLRRRSVEDLTQLLTARTDLANPPVGDLRALAARACTRASLARTIHRFDSATLHLFLALAVAGGDPLDVHAAADLAGAPLPRVQATVDQLWRLALVWRSPPGDHLLREAVECLGPYPAGLASPHRDDAALGQLDPTALQATLDRDPAGRAIVERMLWGPPVGVITPGSPTRKLIEPLVAQRILRWSDDTMRVVLPRPVALALRGHRLRQQPLELEEPALITTQVSPAQVATGAGGDASTLLAQLEELADTWGQHPVRVLRSGGVSVRDLRAAATQLEIPVAQAALLIEVGHAAGLIANDRSLEPVWAPTPRYDEWLALPPAHRWLVLVGAWRDTDRAPHRITAGMSSGTDPGPPINPLTEQVIWPPIRPLRTELLGDLARLPMDASPDPDSLVHRLLWRHPMRDADQLTDAARGILREAAWLGLTYAGAMAPPGQALFSGQDAGPDDMTPVGDIAALVDEHLPAPMQRVLLQADLTAVAPGRIEGAAAQLLRLAADIESRGAASVFRFSPSSIRRVLDAGWSAEQLLEALAQLAGGPPDAVPQPLAYLVSDTARRHGVIRLGAAATYLRSADIALLDELLADRRLAALRLRRVEPGIVISQSPPATALQVLRTHGYAPLAEDTDGAAVMMPPPQHRAPAPQSARHPTIDLSPDDGAGLDDAPDGRIDLRQAAEVAARLLGTQAPTEPTGTAHHEPTDNDPVLTQVILREAAAAGRRVRIGVSDGVGRVRTVEVVPERIAHGSLYAVSGRDGATMRVPVTRITGVQPL